MCYPFAGLDKKHKLFGNFEKILKIFDKNPIEKLNFSRLFENLLLKIEPSEITAFFSDNSFIFGGRNVPCVPPGCANEIGMFSRETIDDVNSFT